MLDSDTPSGNVLCTKCAPPSHVKALSPNARALGDKT